MAGFDIFVEAFELLFTIALWIFIAAPELDIFGARSRKTIHRSLEWLQLGITKIVWNELKQKPPDKFESNSRQNKISRRSRSSRIRTIAIFGLTFFGFGKVERSINFTATSIKNLIVSNCIAVIEGNRQPRSDSISFGG